jgi:hypothetical protein
MANHGRAGSTCSLLLVTEEADRQQLEAACGSAGLTALDLPLASSLEGKADDHMGSNHRLNVELDLQSLLGLQLYLLAGTPQLPSAFGLKYEGRYWLAKIDDISL